MIEGYAYDCEVLPNFFSVIFVNVQTKRYRTFIITKQRNDHEKLISFLSTCTTLYGYNNHGYDDLLLIHLINLHKQNIPAINEDIYFLSKFIIDEDEYGLLTKYGMEKYKYKIPGILSIDIMKIMAYDVLRIGLKWVALRMDWKKIEEMHVPWDEDISNGDVRKLLEYNLNDVLITAYLATFPQIEKVIVMRQKVSKQFGVDVTSASESSMANKLLEKIYIDASGENLYELRKKRTNRRSIAIKDIVPSNIQFFSKNVQKFYNEFLKYKIKKIALTTQERWVFDRSDNRKQSFAITINKKIYDIGVGGLHSRNEPQLLRSNNKRSIEYADVTSFYPSIIEELELCPAHLNKDIFVKVYSDLVTKRREAIKNGDDAYAYGFKIMANSVFGKFGSKFFWLYDRKAFFSVTIAGQLYLMMLIEQLESVGIPIISANTDGIIANVPLDMIDEYRKVCKKWCSMTGFNLDYEKFKVLVIKDILNYYAETDNHKIHSKGIFVSDPGIGKSLKFPRACRIMLHRYFSDGVKPKDSISEFETVYPFIMAQKMDKSFSLYYKHNRGKVPIQNVTRYVATMDGGELKKQKADTEISLLVDVPITPVNDILDPDISKHRINTDYYIDETQKVINQIVNYQTQLTLY